MGKTPNEPMMVWHSLRRYDVWVVIGVVLVAVVYGLLFVWIPYQREQRIARQIESFGGFVGFDSDGAGIYVVQLANTQVTDAGLEHLKGLNNLIILSLYNTQTTAEGRAIYRYALRNCLILP